MRLARIVINDAGDQQAVFLKEVDGDRTFPILIGIFEASSIERRINDEVSKRPYTHDLLKGAIEALGGEAEEIAITRLVEHTYFGVIRIRKDGELIELDCRPSDALALSVHYAPHLPVLVSSDVLDEVT